MKLNIVLIIPFILAAACYSNAIAYPVPAYDAPVLLEKSDTVLVGTVVTGPDQSHPRFASIRIDRILKAATGVRENQIITLSLSELQTSDLRGGSHGLFLLLCGKKTTCDATNSFEPAWPAIANLPITLGGGRVSENIEPEAIFEIVSVISSSDNVLAESNADKQISVEYAAQTRAKAGRILTTMPIEQVRAALIAAGTPSNQSIRLALVAAQIRAGDFSSISAVAVAMMSDTPSLSVGRLDVASALGYVQHPPESIVEPMTMWLSSPDIQVRRMAAYTLRNIGTSKIVAPLIQLGLNDPSGDVRYYSVTGLAQATGEGEYPTRENFSSAESQYIKYWALRKESIMSKFSK